MIKGEGKGGTYLGCGLLWCPVALGDGFCERNSG